MWIYHTIESIKRTRGIFVPSTFPIGEELIGGIPCRLRTCITRGRAALDGCAENHGKSAVQGDFPWFIQALADIRPAPRADDKRFPYSGRAHIGGGPELGRRHRRGKAAEAPKPRGRADRIRIGSNDGIPCRRRGSPDRMAKSDGIEKENGAFRIKTERMNRANKKPVGGWIGK